MKLENFGVTLAKSDHKTKEQQRAIPVAENSIQRIVDQYQERLSWKEDNFKLPDSFPMARQRLN